MGLTQSIARTHLRDLTPKAGFLTASTKEKLSAEAAKRWAHASRHLVTREELQKSWEDLTRDFHANAHWNFPIAPQQPAPVKKQNLAAILLWIMFAVFAGIKIFTVYFSNGGR